MSAGGDGAGPVLDELQGDRVARERAKADLLDVQHDLGHVFLDRGDGAELVEDVGDLDGGHGRPLERAEQDAAQGVAQRDAVAGGQRLDLEAASGALRLDLFNAAVWTRVRSSARATPSASSTRRRAAR